MEEGYGEWGKSSSRSDEVGEVVTQLIVVSVLALTWKAISIIH